jgi:hypothetical protein
MSLTARRNRSNEKSEGLTNVATPQVKPMTELPPRDKDRKRVHEILERVG